MTNTNTLQSLYNSLLVCETHEDFSALFSGVIHLTDIELLQFLKRTGVYQVGSVFKNSKHKDKKSIKIHHPEYFWHSQIPIAKCKTLFQSSFAEELLFGYFSKPENSNPSLNKLVLEINPKAFCKVLKLTQAFLNNEWYKSIYCFNTTSRSELKLQYKEITYFFELNKSWLNKKSDFISILSQFSIEEVLIQVISYFEKYKRSAIEVANNKALLTSKEVTLCYVLNNMLSDYKNISKASGVIISPKYSIEELQNQLHQELPPLNPPEGLIKNIYLPVEEISSEKQSLREVIEFYFSHYVFGVLMDKYCIGLLDFALIDGEYSELLANDHSVLFDRNDKKNHYQNLYYLNAVSRYIDNSFDLDTNDFERFMNVQTNLHQMKELCVIPKDILLDKTLDLLWNFSNWFMPQGRTITAIAEDIENKDVSFNSVVAKKSIPADFAKLFKSDYLIAISEIDLIDACVKYFKWTKSEAKTIINFLTCDLNSTSAPYIDFLTRPLIKVADNFYWLSSLLRDRNWSNLMFRRLTLNKMNDHGVQAKELENKIASQFKSAGFNAIASRKYNELDGEGEIDCVAYKNGVLILIELKTTYLCEDLLRQSEFDNRKFELKSANQLDRAVNYLKDNFVEFKKANSELQIVTTFEEIEIFTLILSNTFDWDSTIKNGKHLKISLLELEIILENNLYDLLNTSLPKQLGGIVLPVNEYDSLTNANNPMFKKQKLDTSKINCDLWDGKELTAHKFIDLIQKNRVWDFIDKLWIFTSTTRATITPFDSTIKWLS